MSPLFGRGWVIGVASGYQAAGKRFQAVILSEAKNLALSIFKTMRDPSSPAAPQDDSLEGFFRSLLVVNGQFPASSFDFRFSNFDFPVSLFDFPVCTAGELIV